MINRRLKYCFTVLLSSMMMFVLCLTALADTEVNILGETAWAGWDGFYASWKPAKRLSLMK